MLLVSAFLFKYREVDMYSVINEKIQFVKGVGPKKAEKLNRLGVFTIKDALYYFPRQFEDRSVVKKIFELKDKDKVSIKGEIKSIIARAVRRKILIEIRVQDDTGSIKLVFFNKPYLKNSFKVGDVIKAFGTVKKSGGFIEMVNCEIEYERLNKNTGLIFPIYRLTNGVSNKDIVGVIRNILDNTEYKIKEYLPNNILQRRKLCDINFAIKSMHLPDTKENVSIAMYRLIFEEFLFMQLGLFGIRGENNNKIGILNKKNNRLDEKISKMPFELTNAQFRALGDILGDMNSERMMNRLVQGDVGSGKTVVAQLALYHSVLNCHQGAYMAPTEILARQHYESFLEFFEGEDIKVEILTGSTTKKNRDRILEELKNGEIDILIGTHAILEDRVEFLDLGLVITDEQHRFGVRQRGKLISKSENPDVLVMTATPIPRTLALILYGDLDISIIDELPPGRKPIETMAIEKSKREAYYYRNVVGELKNNHQVYIVCPLVEESEKMDLSSAEEVYEEMKYQFFREYRVGLLHGKMKSSEKEDIMEKFKNHEIDILVSTTVIEVGVNVPNATMMIIENAERFGLAQLHQLRGRVGRGSDKSYCTLIYDSKTDVTKERMKVMEESNDGFVISETDLKLRGPGDFFGTRQHGLPELTVANLFRHMRILRTAQEEARMIYSNDPLLKNKDNVGIKEKVDEMFSKIDQNISL